MTIEQERGTERWLARIILMLLIGWLGWLSEIVYDLEKRVTRVETKIEDMRGKFEALPALKKPKEENAFDRAPWRLGKLPQGVMLNLVSVDNETADVRWTDKQGGAHRLILSRAEWDQALKELAHE